MSDRQEITIDPGVEALLINHDWPGNVREMENVIDRAIILADGNRITMADLPAQITKVDHSAILGDNVQSSGSLRDQMRKFEVALILRTIEETGGDRRAAAQKLNIGLSSLYRKLEELGGNQPLPEGGHAGKEVRQE